MMKKQQRIPKVSVGTVKKSMAAMASRWFRRKVSQRFAGSGSWVARFTQRGTVRSEMLKPSLSRESDLGEQLPVDAWIPDDGIGGANRYFVRMSPRYRTEATD